MFIENSCWPQRKECPNHLSSHSRDKEEDSLEGEQFSSVSLTKAEWLMLLVVRLKGSHAWELLRSRQVENFQLMFCVLMKPLSEQSKTGQVNGPRFANEWRGIGGQTPGILGVTVLGKTPKLERVQLLQRATENRQGAWGQIQTSWRWVR